MTDYSTFSFFWLLFAFLTMLILAGGAVAFSIWASRRAENLKKRLKQDHLPHIDPEIRRQ